MAITARPNAWVAVEDDPATQLSGRASRAAARGSSSSRRAADMIAHGDEHQYRVLVTPGGPCNGIAVTARAAEGFEVAELLDGTSDAEFDWLVIARKRRELVSAEPDELPASPPDVMEPPSPDEPTGGQQ